jgi:hypothetical protein
VKLSREELTALGSAVPREAVAGTRHPEEMQKALNQ